jgi:site-specific recombinase
LVSFSLALFVALKARKVSYGEWISLGKLIGGHFITRPSDFFLPPSKESLVANEPLDAEQINVAKKSSAQAKISIPE